jgi:hypothetical protein
VNSRRGEGEREREGGGERESENDRREARESERLENRDYTFLRFGGAPVDFELDGRREEICVESLFGVIIGDFWAIGCCGCSSGCGGERVGEEVGECAGEWVGE